MTTTAGHAALLRRGLRLEYATLAWNVAGAAIVLTAGITARSVALVSFGLDSTIEILASTIVIWHLRDTHTNTERTALLVLGSAFLVVAIYVLIEATLTLTSQDRPQTSAVGIAWTATTFVVMCALAAAKARTGRALANQVLLTEGRVTLVDAYLAAAILTSLLANATIGWWRADPLAALAIVAYATKEGITAIRKARPSQA